MPRLEATAGMVGRHTGSSMGALIGSMGIEVRATQGRDDLEALNAGSPQTWIVTRWREIDTPDVPSSSVVALADGRPAGWAAAAPNPFAQAGLSKALVHVLAPARRRGVRSALREVVEQVMRAAGLPGVQATYEVDCADAAAAVAAWAWPDIARHQET